MRWTRRDLLRAGVCLPASLLPPGWKLDAARAAPLTAGPGGIDGEDIVLAHISDAHILANHNTAFNALKAVLQRVRVVNPSLLIDTGDITEDSSDASYQRYLQAYADTGGFGVPPDYGAGIPVYIVAGNHDYCGLPGYGYQENLGTVSDRHSLVVGNYRLVGTSGNTDWAPSAWPAGFLNSQMSASCADGKPLVFFHHFCPHGWAYRAQSRLYITPQGWATIDALAQKYRVLAYLCGHCHYDRYEIEPPGYFVHSVDSVVTGGLTLHALADGHINTNSTPGAQTYVLITRPAQFMDGLDHADAPASLSHTHTPAQQTLVRAYVRVAAGEVVRVTCRLDDRAAVLMQRLGDSDYWQTTLDARGLTGRHRLSVAATPSQGAGATHQIACWFSDRVPSRIAPGCATQSHTLSLHAGWNLISVPFTPLAPAPADVLRDIAGQYTEIMTLPDPQSPRSWALYCPSAPSYVNTLSAMVPQCGYWLRTTAPVQLTLLGNPLTPPRISLCSGWNLVGYPSLTAQPIAQALATIAGQFEAVYAYEPADSDNPWRIYAPDANPIRNEINVLRPGRGYWILARTNCTWTLS